MYTYCERTFEELVGKTLVSVRKEDDRDGDELIFETTDGEKFILYHYQDCCESVYIEDIAGDLSDLVGSPIVQAELATNEEEPPQGDYVDESYTWTFYKIATIKGSVTIRWYGSSNGYYSESVDLRVEQAD